MKAVIINYRRGRATMKGNHIIVEAKNIKDRKSVTKLIGKKVIYKTSANKKMVGKIASAHGNKGAMRVIFRKGLPGSAIGESVEILE